MLKCIVLEAVINARRVMIAWMHIPLVGAANLKNYASAHAQAVMVFIPQENQVI